jgi:ATP-dependent helicase/nuclease subunit A
MTDTQHRQGIPGHVAISASAGSGKTFQLAHRYIRLLVNGVPPERICALTFSRKAAQEIFDSIVEHLVRGAQSPDEAKAISARIDFSKGSCEIYLQALRGMLNGLNRLQIGTLDSFIIGVVRAFPSELGVAMDFQVMDEGSAAAQEMRRDVLSQIFDPRKIDVRTQADFLEAFKQATFGREEKSTEFTLDRFIERHHRRYQSIPSPAAWGDASMIWPEGPTWPPPRQEISESVDPLRDLLESADLTEKRRERWGIFLDAVQHFDAHTMWSKQIEFLFTKLTGILDDLRLGTAELKADRQTQDMPPDQCRLALAIIAHVMAVEIRVALETTQGLHRVLESYHRIYDERARRSGRMTFSDAQYLLTDTNRLSGGLLLSRDFAATDRLFIDYRLDARLDHWLLDEFQDTSDLQWAAIGNLVDEIVQDVSGERSFFYVGDVKQAIYTWRQGNPRLFARVLNTYGEGRIVCETLSTSFRSCAAVIDVVNAIFQDIEHPELTPAVAERWRSIWQTHECRTDIPPPQGYAAILEPPYSDESKPDAEDRYRVVADLIRELDPMKRGLEVAVLVRKNDSGRAVVDMLRRECPGLPVVHEGNAPIGDNPAVAVLLSLIRFAAHPGDTFAWRHLQMSPLKTIIMDHGGRERLPLHILSRIHLAGFQQLIRDWSSLLEAAITLDDFARMRLDDLARAAGEFDAMHSHACDAFLRFIDAYEISEVASGQAVRVMTIHQSKGLGFDVVILPDLMQRNMLKSHDIDVVEHRDRDSDQPEWVLKMPRKDIRNRDPVLVQAVTEVDDDASFDALCLLYVAMTRARRGLYVVSSYPGKSSDMVSQAAFLKYRLTGDPKPVLGDKVEIGGKTVNCIYGHGKADWYRTLTREDLPPTPAAETQPDPVPASPAAGQMMTLEPSGQEQHERPASQLFGRNNQDALDLGNAIHALFERVDWTSETDPALVIDDWRATVNLPDETTEGICNHFLGAYNDDAFQQALTRPAGNVELWREKPFEALIPDIGWVRGIFDRVVIHLNDMGQAESLVIQDYKSNLIRDEMHLDEISEGYRSQLTLYGQAAAHMFRLRPDRVSLQLLFTRNPKVYDLTVP